jgi:hypothetical protein
MRKKNRGNGISPSDLHELFGRPTLQKGEDRTAYDLLRERFVKELKPVSIVDAFDVQEISDVGWETLRLHPMETKIVAAERNNAIANLMDPKSGYVSEEDGRSYRSYKASHPMGMDEAKALNRIGLSQVLINATALFLAAEKVLFLDKMVATRVTSRGALLSNYLRRKRQEEKEKRLATKSKRQQERRDNHKRSAAHKDKPNEQNDWK